MQGKRAPNKPTVIGEKTPTSLVRPAPYPDSLVDALERTCWDEITVVMKTKEIFDEDCVGVVLAYCTHRARFIQANGHITKQGLILKNGKRNPWLLISNTACDRMVKLASELGLTPTTRSRALKTHKSEVGEESVVDQFLKVA